MTESDTPVRTVILVEGDSDEVAVSTLAAIRGRRLADEGVEVVAMNGAHGIARSLGIYGPAGLGLRIGGLCDAAEETVFMRALRQAGLGAPTTRAELAALGFFVCDRDLEEELIRALSVAELEAVLDAEGALASFRRMARQVAWRAAPFPDQLRRFLGAGSFRKHRFAKALVEAIGPSRAPEPLDALLAWV